MKELTKLAIRHEEAKIRAGAYRKATYIGGALCLLSWAHTGDLGGAWPLTFILGAAWGCQRVIMWSAIEAGKDTMNAIIHGTVQKPEQTSARGTVWL